MVRILVEHRFIFRLIVVLWCVSFKWLLTLLSLASSCSGFRSVYGSTGPLEPTAHVGIRNGAFCCSTLVVLIEYWSSCYVPLRVVVAVHYYSTRKRSIKEWKQTHF